VSNLRRVMGTPEFITSGQMGWCPRAPLEVGVLK